jgi:hypothetical protein
MDKFFVLADERGPRYSSSWTYHLNRIIIIYKPQNAQSLFRVPDEFCANMLRYPFMPEDILKHKVATAVAEDERQHMGELLRIIEENDTRDQEEAESTAEEERKERKQYREIERAVDEYIEDCAEGSDFYNFDDNSDDEANCMDEDEK